MDASSAASTSGSGPDDGDVRRSRNVCILAHVDHGKTTLADHLIAGAGGGVLHPRMAGRVRFLDFLDEEQRRAITMKSSAASLFVPCSDGAGAGHRVCLIDSPGHVDFCSEVSAAARLADGALILVDAVEGVHIQTHAALRQAWLEKLTPCLVLNKLDRLIVELHLSPAEAYARLLRIVSEVNTIFSLFNSQKFFSDVDALLSTTTSDQNPDFLAGEGTGDGDDNEDTFQPQKGNVTFACALEGWGFRIEQFAEVYASRLGASASALLRGLWGPRYYHPKKKMIVGKKGIESAGLSDPQPMFVQFVLQPIWQLYEAARDGNRPFLEKAIKNFSLKLSARDLQTRDIKVLLHSILSQWLPLSDAVLKMVIDCVPDPVAAQASRISRLVPKRELSLDDATAAEQDIVAEAELVRKCVECCDTRLDAPTVVFVSKMFAIPYKMLPRQGLNGGMASYHSNCDEGQGEGDECFLAFARVFSGVLRVGQKIFVLSALYDPLKGADLMQRHLQVAEVQSIYRMMGQGLNTVASVCAGNVVAVQGFAHCILKSATLSSTKNCWPFSSMMFQVSPMLRVAIEPSDPADMAALTRGLRLLNRADPFVEISVSSRGEQVLAAAGEVHLERCIKDLNERFAKVKLEVSAPLVSFKETIEGDPLGLMDGLKASHEFVEKTTPNGRCTIRVHVFRLPDALTKVLEENVDLLKDIIEGKPGKDSNNSLAFLRKRIMDAIDGELEGNVSDKEKCTKLRKKWHGYLERIWSLGPSQVGPNMLIVPNFKASETCSNSNLNDKGILIRGPCHVSQRLGFIGSSDEGTTMSDLGNREVLTDDDGVLHLEAEALKSIIFSGFQFATSSGPLCDEPTWGLAFVIEPYIFQDTSEAAQQADRYSTFTSQVMAVVKDAFRASVLQNKPRLVEAMYFCELNSPSEYLGPMYAVLGRRRAKILKVDLQEGSNMFNVHAYLPVAESFGFSDELRKHTSGGTSALMVLSHWEAIAEDPFFVPKTEEEIEEFGDGSSILPNLARRLMNSVRRRKGLHVEEKVVQHATKQRTLARKV